MHVAFTSQKISLHSSKESPFIKLWLNYSWIVAFDNLLVDILHPFNQIVRPHKINYSSSYCVLLDVNHEKQTVIDYLLL